MDQSTPVETRHQRRERERRERKDAATRGKRGSGKRWAIAAGIAVLVVAGAVIAALAGVGKSSIAANGSGNGNVNEDPGKTVIATAGIHWHPHLEIDIKGQPQAIPEGIGLGTTEKFIHTHDTSGTIHLEFPGRVLAKDIELSEFFKNWGKTLTPTCILDKCNGPEGTVSMTVNGKPNTEFGSYVMHDGDKIVIAYN